MSYSTRRSFLARMGLSAAALPFAWNLPSLSARAGMTNPSRKNRLIVMFSPNGIVPREFWPDQTGTDFTLKRILKPLEPFRDQLLTLKGVANRVRGDGDNHMRGMSCLLTGIELFPGNIQGGSHTPAGWPRGLSIDQEIKNYLQSQDQTRTRFGSLEFGVLVPDRADPWTRMSFSGPNQPVAPIDDPYQMFKKLYGQRENRALVQSVLDDVRQDLSLIRSQVSGEDRQLLDQHATFVREMEQDLVEAGKQKLLVAPPELEPGLRLENENLPTLARMQADLLVNSLANDMARVATFEYTNSVGQARMNWLGVDESHHSLSHEADDNEDAQEKLIKINTWFAEELAYLAKRLAETPEPDGHGSMLDNTTIVWTNELGKGNSHTLNDIPFVMVGGGMGFQMGRALDFENKIAHNRLLMAFAHGFGHHIDSFGSEELSADGPLSLS